MWNVAFFNQCIAAGANKLVEQTKAESRRSIHTNIQTCTWTAGAGVPDRAGFARAGVEVPSPAVLEPTRTFRPQTFVCLFSSRATIDLNFSAAEGGCAPYCLIDRKYKASILGQPLFAGDSAAGVLS
jgi:hypothetical protein